MGGEGFYARLTNFCNILPGSSTALREVLMRILCGIALLASAAFLAGCGLNHPTFRGSGITVTEARAAAGFSSIDVSGFGEVRIEQTGTESVIVEAENNLMPLLVTTVENGRLKLGSKQNVDLRPTRPVIFRVTVNRLDAVSISGSGDIIIPSLRTDALSARISGSGNMRIAGLEAARFRGEISGAGEAHVAGHADDVGLHISGSGAYYAAGLECRTADISISGSGSATVNASRELSVQVSGSGSVQYLGEPRINTHVSGSGSVSHARANAS
jgi:hypothetical protein